jgi:hypothetical protein
MEFEVENAIGMRGLEQQGGTTHDRVNAADANDICKIHLDFEILKGQLALLGDMLKENGATQEWNHQTEDLLERQTNFILDKMRVLSENAASRHALDFKEIRLKAQIWLERWVPESGDDIGSLAASICRDIITIASNN